MQQPFYDPTKSYDENYDQGPFGVFAEVVKGQGLAATVPAVQKFDYMGQSVDLPFGIPAGPLLNSNFIKAAFAKKFAICVYKSVRSGAFPCHPFPNVLPVTLDGDLTLEKMQQSVVTKAEYSEPLSITNSFGVPSKEANVWQEDAKKAVSYAGPGQVMVLSFMGTVRPDQSQQAFIDDFTLAGKLANETGAKVIEANLSCPNIGNEGLVCYNLEVTKQICRSLRRAIGNTPLVLKVGYYPNQAELEKLAEIAQEYANGISGINTLQATIVNQVGEQALPGNNRAKSGICGAGIKWAGLEMVKRLVEIKQKKNYTFHVEGVGGVMSVADFAEYRTAGANSVMSATGAMWNPNLAEEVWNAVHQKV